jgi:UDP-2-acetamido-2-deoxy-ribo-hexuluronate aminotransferase
MALGIGAGRRGGTSPFSFFATAEIIALLGAKPVFVDIDPATYNLDPALCFALRSRRGPRPSCRSPSMANAPRWTRSLKIAGDIPVIEDAAQSFGATYKGRQSCNLSRSAAPASSHQSRSGCYGDGGACLHRRRRVSPRSMQMLRNHGQDRRYHHPVIGVNARMDDDPLSATMPFGGIAGIDH